MMTNIHMCLALMYKINLELTKYQNNVKIGLCLLVCFCGTLFAYAQISQPQICPQILRGYGLTFKHKTKLKKHARDKHTCIFGTFVYYGGKTFYNIGPWYGFGDLVIGNLSVEILSLGIQSQRRFFTVRWSQLGHK